MAGRFVAINQFDGTSKVLKIDLVTSSGEVVGADEISEDKISFGLFDIYEVNDNLNFVALLATPNGPLLFINNAQYRPELGKTKIALRDDGDGVSHFLVLHESNPIFGLFYKSKFGIGLHPYNRERDDIDFYYWLSKKVQNPRFYEVYSKELISIE